MSALSEYNIDWNDYTRSMIENSFPKKETPGNTLSMHFNSWIEQLTMNYGSEWR